MNITDFIPLFAESSETIRARMDADVNTGLTADDPLWVDTREGTFYWDVTQVAVLELARLWDALSVEVPAAAFLLFAWGPYLDYHAAMFGEERKAATFATGTVLFTGDPGTVVTLGTTVSADLTSGDSIEFATTDAGTFGAQVSRPGTVTPTVSQSAGTLAAGTYYYRVSAYNGFGETDGSDEVSGTITTSSGQVVLAWPHVVGATGYRIYRSTVADGPYVRIDTVADSGSPSYTDNGGQTPGVAGPPSLNTTSGVRLTVEAVTAGQVGNVDAGAIDTLEALNAGVQYVTNEQATADGADEESDLDLRARLLVRFLGQGAGNKRDYQRWALEHEGVGQVFVIPVASGPGTVGVVLMDADGDPVGSPLVTEVQDDLDPTAGQGDGRAPIGADVTVSTPVTIAIAVAGTITHKTGFSLDGAGGTTPTRAAITAKIKAYVDGLEVGDDVIYDHVKAQFFQADGVLSVSGVTVNTGTSNVAISSTPPQIAALTLPVTLA